MPPPAHECPSSDALAAFARGEGNAGPTGPVAHHVENCPLCRKRAAELAPTGVVRAQLPGLPAELLQSGEYEDVVELGRGGMGVVYRARNTLMGRVEVLKVMGREVMSRPGAADRFRQEIQAAARLNHPNVVGAYSARMIGGLLVFNMEYVAGTDFDRLVRDRGALPVAHAAHYARQVAAGLQHAHEQGMVHRDIKPANLILARDGKRSVVKILDFGLARVTSEDGGEHRLTAAGKMLGTPAYMSPEQAFDAQSADTRSDIYSLGCTLYFFLTGRPPFRADTVVGVLIQHRSATAAYLHTVRPDVPVGLAAVVAQMMEKEPARRYQTPAAVAAALAPFARTGFDPPVDPAPASVELVRPPVVVPPSTWAVHPAPQPPVSATVVQPASGAWESLPPGSGVAADADPPFVPSRRRKPKRRRFGIAAGAIGASAVVAVLALWAAGAFAPAPGARLVIDDLPRDAEVEVDGRKVAAARDGDDGVVELPRRARYRVRVVRGTQELFSNVVSVEDGFERIRVRAAPIPSASPRPTVPTPKSPQPPQPPTFTAADRQRWVYSAGTVSGVFTREASSEWVEVTSQGTTYRFRETARTPEYVEIFREPDGRLRLLDTQCLVVETPTRLRFLYAGSWVGSAAGAPVPGVAAPTFAAGALLSDKTFPGESIETAPNRHGESGGHYVIDCPTPISSAWNVADVPADFAVEAVARMKGGSFGSWGLNLTNIQVSPAHGVQVMLNGKGELSVLRGMFEREAKAVGPNVRTPTLPVVKGGAEYNTLLLILRNRVLEVFVNGVRATDPVALDRDVSPARIAMTAINTASTPPLLAEFRRVRTWRLDAKAAATSAPTAPPPVVEATRGWRVEGNELVGSISPTGAPGTILFGNTDWTDVSLEFEARAVGGPPDFYALARHARADSYVMAAFGPGSTSVRASRNGLLSFTEKAWKSDATPSLPQGWRGVPRDEWFSVALTAQAQTVRVQVDGRPWSSQTNTRPEVWAGQVGFTVMSGVTRFRNIRVTDTRGVELWNRPPDPP